MGHREDKTHGTRLVERGYSCPGVKWRALGSALAEGIAARRISTTHAATMMGVRSASIFRLTNGNGAASNTSAVVFLAVCEWLQANPMDFFIGMNPQRMAALPQVKVKDVSST